jgi:hypothetical protein
VAQCSEVSLVEMSHETSVAPIPASGYSRCRITG